MLIILFIILFLFFGLNQNTPEPKKRITVVFPSVSNYSFFSLYHKAMKAAAEDLNIDLTVYWSNWNFTRMTYLINKAVNSSPRPDAIIFNNFSKKGLYWIQITNRAKVPNFIINVPISAEGRKLSGKPREKYTYWIGQITPDNFIEGYNLSSNLLKTARANIKGKLYVLGIGGVDTTVSTIERFRGLQVAAKEVKNIKIIGHVPANWDKALAKERFIAVKTTQDPRLNVVSVASNTMAFGVIEAAKELKIKLNSDLFVGTYGWDKKTANKIKKKELVATIGAHFFEGAWVIILLHDYLHGIDFANEKVVWITKMLLMDQTNVYEYEKLIQPEKWYKINFKDFSKVYNKKLKKYDFNLQQFLPYIL